MHFSCMCALLFNCVGFLSNERKIERKNKEPCHKKCLNFIIIIMEHRTKDKKWGNNKIWNTNNHKICTHKYTEMFKHKIT